jgi:hypothetical protein
MRHIVGRKDKAVISYNQRKSQFCIEAKQYSPEGRSIWAKAIGTVAAISSQTLRLYSKCTIFGKFFFRAPLIAGTRC